MRTRRKVCARVSRAQCVRAAIRQSVCAWQLGIRLIYVPRRARNTSMFPLHVTFMRAHCGYVVPTRRGGAQKAYISVAVAAYPVLATCSRH